MNKNFWSNYAGAIIGGIVGILVLALRIVDIIVGAAVVVGCALLGAYVQRNKTTVKDKLKGFIDKI